MHKLFYPNSIVIYGLSSKPNNIAKLILENLIRWGYRGRILGINSRSTDVHVDGIRIYRSVEDLPIVPDVAVAMTPAKLIPSIIEACGQKGIGWMAIPPGGFNELNQQGKDLAAEAVAKAKAYGVRFVGPNALTIANTANGLCFPFVPSYSPPRGGLSIISQSGGVGLMLWNFMTDENVGMAKFASIGNKLDLDEIDFLEYFGNDPETRVIGLYLESISRGREFIDVASSIDKPILVLKAGRTENGRKAAMSHTAALANDDAIVDAAFERAGVIRINELREYLSVTKAFDLPAMRGNRVMVMSPAGGATVMMADICKEQQFAFAEPGERFYQSLNQFANAGVINFTNPLDMGDVYDPYMQAHILNAVVHNDNVDGAVYVTQWPHMPRGDDVFTKMFNTDLSKEAIGTMRSAEKPMAACLFGLSKTIARIKHTLPRPIFNTPEEMISALRKQHAYHIKKSSARPLSDHPESVDRYAAQNWVESHKGVCGEEVLELLAHFGIQSPPAGFAREVDEAVSIAERIEFPVVLKVVSKNIVHKSEVGGVRVDIRNSDAIRAAYRQMVQRIESDLPTAKLEGFRVIKQAQDGCDMMIGGTHDPAFGQVLVFGFGGIYVEIFNDVAHAICPASREEIRTKLERLKSFRILKGARGLPTADIDAFVDAAFRVSHLLHAFHQIKELDINPIRVHRKGLGVVALDGRARIS